MEWIMNKKKKKHNKLFRKTRIRWRESEKNYMKDKKRFIKAGMHLVLIPYWAYLT